MTAYSLPQTVIKRDGRTVPFDITRVDRAISRSFDSIGKAPRLSTGDLTECVGRVISFKFNNNVPTVEHIQDIVEMVLLASNEYEAAKAYILYRDQHEKARNVRTVPQSVKDAFEISSRYFETPLQLFQFTEKYSRFNSDLGRRETWIETVDRAVNHLMWLSDNKLSDETYTEIYNAILNMEAMPSMRLLAMAGPAAVRNPISIYNCSFVGVDSIDSFVEALIISMAGGGVGFSVESKYINKLPDVPFQITNQPVDTYIIPDTSEGWAEALRAGLSYWLDGWDLKFDYSQLRPAGAILKTKGGRSSGPGVLQDLMRNVREIIFNRQGQRLTSLDCHDIMCHVGNAAVAGGVRRTAMISLFDIDDEVMLHCKDESEMNYYDEKGNYHSKNTQRWNANNSAVWTDDRKTRDRFEKYFKSMISSNNGEPGIFNLSAALRMKPDHRTLNEFTGTNPCGEINLRHMEFCNLSICVARPDDTRETLANKVRIATIIGTIQSLAVDFQGLRPEWRKNCEEERLLGVDITGQMDCPAVQDAETLQYLRQVAIDTNKEFAGIFGINQAAAITCVKPSGNSSALLNCSSGLHARMEKFFIRNARISATSPVFQVLKEQGVPMDPENGQTRENANTWVIHFPEKSPEGSKTRHDRDEIEQLEYWLLNKLNWTQHNPSATITYRPEKADVVMNWVWDHFDQIGGMSFLPWSNAAYKQMPYEAIPEEVYNYLAPRFPIVDYSKIWLYEYSDTSTASQEAACVSGACEVEIVPTA